MEKFGDRAFCVYAPRLGNELPDNIKAADSVQKLQDKAKNIVISEGVYLTIWTINICPLTIRYNALLNIIGGKGAIANIKYYYQYYC